MGHVPLIKCNQKIAMQYTQKKINGSRRNIFGDPLYGNCSHVDLNRNNFYANIILKKHKYLKLN